MNIYPKRIKDVDLLELLEIVAIANSTDEKKAHFKNQLEIWCQRACSRRTGPELTISLARRLAREVENILKNPKEIPMMLKSPERRGAILLFMQCHGITIKQIAAYDPFFVNLLRLLQEYLRVNFLSKRGPKPSNLSRQRGSLYSMLAFILKEADGKVTLSKVGPDPTGTMPALISKLRKLGYISGDPFEGASYKIYQDASEWDFRKTPSFLPIDRK